MAASSSSSGSPLYAVWLHDFAGNRVQLVDIPVNAPAPSANPDLVPASIPELLLFNGNNYLWSRVLQRYHQVVAFAPPVDTGAPLLSVVCDPQV